MTDIPSIPTADRAVALVTPSSRSVPLVALIPQVSPIVKADTLVMPRPLTALTITSTTDSAVMLTLSIKAKA